MPRPNPTNHQIYYAFDPSRDRAYTRTFAPLQERPFEALKPPTLAQRAMQEFAKLSPETKLKLGGGVAAAFALVMLWPSPRPASAPPTL
jgi:hypothetical protein